jgi:hypothetical protein
MSLPERRRTGTGWDPARPLILGAWCGSPALLKIARLDEHIRFAQRHRALLPWIDIVAPCQKATGHILKSSEDGTH